MYKDEYVQGIVAKQIKERFQEKVKPIFGEDCFVMASFYSAIPTIEELVESFEGETPSLEYFKNLTIEEYYKMDEDIRLAIRIFVNKESLEYSEEKVREEFEV